VSNIILQDWLFNARIGYGLAIVRGRIANAQVAAKPIVFWFIGIIVFIFY
jgi:hypothetical protein